MLTVKCKVHFEMGRKARKKLEVGDAPPDPEALVEPGRVPRVSRLMALAIRLERLLAEGVARDYADLARLGGVTRARLTQIMNLTLLAPDIQEELLFLPRTLHGRDPICEPMVRPIAAESDWRKQRRMWESLVVTLTPPTKITPQQYLPCELAVRSFRKQGQRDVHTGVRLIRTGDVATGLG